ncbi:hypothetical protein EON83_30165 [bacterium]|nr:MAG: hypothetical protein EON83_30165 [bacterium]
MTAARANLEEIKEWKLEAGEEDNDRYFYHINEVDAVRRGDRNFVIGRKGSGKTAIAENISLLADYNIFVRRLSFKNFPFNELYKHKDAKFTSSQYITFWKYVILSAVCEMMSKNENLDAEATLTLRKVFDLDFDTALSKSINRITSQSGGLTILRSGVNGAYTKTYYENETPWIARVESLEELIKDYVDDSTYYILFDELDEDYKDVLDVDRRSQYFELLGSLFKAVMDLRRKFGREIKIRPVVFIRDDIYELIDDPDSNKWGDLAVQLQWTQAALQQLAAFRISKAIDPQGDILSFSDAVNALFVSPEVTTGGRGIVKRRPVFKHILDRSLMRPRDVIAYLREVASQTLASGRTRANKDNMRDAEAAYSRHLSRELINEMHSVVPHIRDVFDILSDIRKQTVTLEEFSERYDQLKNIHSDLPSFETTCRFLFHFSAIGNQPSQKSTEVFKYRQPGARMNFNESIIIHRGLLKALQIA